MELDPIGEPLVFQEILSHEHFVRSLARKLVHDEHLADDVLQDTYLAALRRPPKPAAPLKAWLARVIHNRAVQNHRRRVHREQRETATARREAQPSAADICEREGVRSHLARAIEAMDEPYRTAIVLRFYEGLEPAEMAIRLGVPVETARTRVKRGVEKLRARLDREFEGRAAWSGLLIGELGLDREAPIAAARPVGTSPRALVGSVALLVGLIIVALVVPRESDGPRAASAPLAQAPSAGPAAMPDALVRPRDALATGTAWTAPPVIETAEATSTLEGQTLDDQGLPLPGVEVFASGWKRNWNEEPKASLSTATSDSHGRFLLTGLPTRFVVDARTQTRFAAEHVVGDLDRATALADFRIVLVEPDPIAGRVIDEQGLPLAGVVVRATRSRGDADARPSRNEGVWYAARSGGKCTTGIDGSFELSKLPPGRFKLTASLEGYQPFGRTAWTGQAAVEFVLTRGTQVEMLVQDERGAAIPDATVTMRRGSNSTRGADPVTVRARSDGSGLAAFANACPDTLAYGKVEAPGWATRFFGPFRIEAGAQPQIVHLAPGRDVSGTIVDADGRTVGGAHVTVWVLPNRDLLEELSLAPDKALFQIAAIDSDETGAFALSSLPRSELELEVRPKAGSLAAFSQRIGPDETQVRIVGGHARDSVVFDGRLRDGRTLAPVRSYTVTALCEDSKVAGVAARIHVDSVDGRFQIAVHEPGKWALVFQADDYTRTIVTVAEAGPGVNSIDALALPERQLDVRVVDRNGRPVPFATLTISDSEGHPIPVGIEKGKARSVALVGPLGEAHLADLPAGRVRVDVFTPTVREPTAFEFELAVPLEDEQVLALADLEVDMARREIGLRLDEAEAGAELRFAEEGEKLASTYEGDASVRVLDQDKRRVLLSFEGTFEFGTFRQASNRRALHLSFDEFGTPTGAYQQEVRTNWGAPHGREFFPQVDPLSALPFPRTGCWLEIRAPGHQPFVYYLQPMMPGAGARSLVVPLAR